MKKVLVTFGDSWPEGSELGSNRTYGKLLQEQMGFDEFYNYGAGATSNEHLVTQLQSYFQKHHKPDYKTTAIFFLTNPHRSAYWPKNYGWHNFGQPPKHWTDNDKQMFIKAWLHFHKEEITNMRSNLVVTTLQQWCKNCGVDDYYFSGWIKYPVWYPSVDVSKIWGKGLETVGDWFGAPAHTDEVLTDIKNNPYVYPNLCHPNKLGHQLIADRLQDWIQSKQ